MLNDDTEIERMLAGLVGDRAALAEHETGLSAINERVDIGARDHLAEPDRRIIIRRGIGCHGKDSIEFRREAAAGADAPAANGRGSRAPGPGRADARWHAPPTTA